MILFEDLTNLLLSLGYGNNTISFLIISRLLFLFQILNFILIFLISFYLMI